jgi:hypothetical protein
MWINNVKNGSGWLKFDEIVAVEGGWPLVWYTVNYCPEIIKLIDHQSCLHTFHCYMQNMLVNYVLNPISFKSKKKLKLCCIV